MKQERNREWLTFVLGLIFTAGAGACICIFIAFLLLSRARQVSPGTFSQTYRIASAVGAITGLAIFTYYWFDSFEEF